MTQTVDRLNLKILRRDKEALERLAISEGETMSVIIRRLVRKELKRRGYLVDIKTDMPKESYKAGANLVHNQ